MISYPSDAELLRSEIAAVAARMIAEDGADYGTAKRKAAKQVLGDTKVRGDVMPDNAQVEDEVRLYNELFFGDSQPAHLADLRSIALGLMTELERFTPYLTGAVLNGTASAHSDIYLHLFAESPKDVEIYLLNRNIDFEVSETPHFNGRSPAVETVSFMWKGEGVHLVLYELDDLRGGGRRIERAGLAGVRALVTGNDTNET
ncbi:MAG: hypothetical protein H7244_09155 [Herminiimonas sp.]|nr:hypothetical protein [Herminiimonas sp.]